MAYTYNDNGNWITGSKQHTDEWVAITKDEEGTIVSPQGLVDFLAQQEADEAVAKQISDAKAYLNDTDYKVLPDYDGDTTGIVEARAEARTLIRSLEG